MKIAIKNARIFDPASGHHGETGEVFIENGRITENLSAPDLEIDAGGRILMAGAIEVAGHVGSYGLNFFRGQGLIAGLKDVAACYVRMGYTLVNEVFATMETAAYSHHELSRLPWVDTSLTLCLPLYDLENLIRSGDVEKCAAIVSAFGNLARCAGFRIFESELTYEQEIYVHRNIESAKLFDFFARVARELKIRFFVQPGISSIDIFSQHPDCFHLVFLLDLLEGEGKKGFEELLDKGVSGGIGFYPAGGFIKIQGDKPSPNQRASRFDVGLTHSVYYVIGEGRGPEQCKDVFELIKKNDAQKIAFSMVLPMNDMTVNYASLWAKIASVFGFSVLSIMTRNIPAEVLCIPDRGNLKAGSRADIAIYDVGDAADERKMREAFSSCLYLIKDGDVVVSERKIVAPEERKKTWYRKYPKADIGAALKLLSQSSFRPENLKVTERIAGQIAELA